jgi:hypothetical protein
MIKQPAGKNHGILVFHGENFLFCPSPASPAVQLLFFSRTICYNTFKVLSAPGLCRQTEVSPFGFERSDRHHFLEYL